MLSLFYFPILNRFDLVRFDWANGKKWWRRNGEQEEKKNTQKRKCMMYIYQICNCVSRMPYKALRHHSTDNGTIIVRQKSVQFVYKYICRFLFISYSLPVLILFLVLPLLLLLLLVVSFLSFCCLVVVSVALCSAIRVGPSKITAKPSWVGRWESNRKQLNSIYQWILNSARTLRGYLQRFVFNHVYQKLISNSIFQYTSYVFICSVCFMNWEYWSATYDRAHGITWISMNDGLVILLFARWHCWYNNAQPFYLIHNSSVFRISFRLLD